MATTRDPGPEQRVAQLENLLAQLTRATLAAVQTFGSGTFFGYSAGTGWEMWQKAGATHQAVTELHGFLAAHPPKDT